MIIGLLKQYPPEMEGGFRLDSSSTCCTPDDSTSDYFSMAHSRQSSMLPCLDELRYLEEEEEVVEEEKRVPLVRSPIKDNLAALLHYLHSQQWLTSVPLSWQRYMVQVCESHCTEHSSLPSRMNNILHLRREEQLSLLHRLWQAIRLLQAKMEDSLPSPSTGREELNHERMLANALTLPL